jgi:hypothetical protein
MQQLARGALLAPEGTLVLETSWRHPPGDVPGLRREDERRYGETLVVCYVQGPAPRAEGEPLGEEGASE